MWRGFLSDEGLSVAVADAAHVLLVDDLNPGHEATAVRFVDSARPVYPSRVPELADGERGLLVVPVASESSVRAARAAGWDLVADDGTIDVRVGDRHIVRRPIASRPSAGVRGRVPRSRWTVCRVLMAQTARVTQLDIASMSGVSQPTVSRVCRSLRDRGFVSLDRTGVEVLDWSALAHWWLASYPGQGGPVSYWYGLEPVAEQMQDLAGVLPDAVFSGSAAADLLSPWQRPDQVVLYTKSPALLANAGFVAVNEIESATVVVAAPADESVWCNSPVERVIDDQTVRLADPLQVVFDVLRGPESGTREEAADRILSALKGPLRSSWRHAWQGSRHGL